MRALILVAALLVVGAAGAGSAGADNPVLTADVAANDSFDISLVDGTGAKVKHLAAGSYTMVVHDHSLHHNFHLTGPGVDVTTDVLFVGDQTFTITVGDGVYTYICDPHPQTMRGIFTAGSVTAPPPGKLIASLSAASSSTLRPLDSTHAGTYVITVSDRSSTDGFRLSGPGVSRATTARFTGTVKWTVALRKGNYEYGSTRFSKQRKVFTIYG